MINDDFMAQASGIGTSLRKSLVTSFAVLIASFVLGDLIAIFSQIFGWVVQALFFISCLATIVLAIIYLVQFKEKALAIISLVIGFITLIFGVIHWALNWFI